MRRGEENKPASDDLLIKQTLMRAGAIINQTTHTWFYPVVQTRYYNHPRMDDRRLKLDDPLLEITTFATQNGAETVASTDYFLMCGGNYNRTPYDRIVMKADGGRPNLLFTGTIQRANVVTGVWGYHDDYGSAWLDSGDVVRNDPLNASDTVLQAAASSEHTHPITGDSSLFQVFQLLRLEDEFLFVTKIDQAGQELTVLRGVNGSVAEAHDEGTAIEIWQPIWDIVQQHIRLSDWLYSQKDGRDDMKDRPIVTASGAVIKPADLPSDVLRALRRYTK